MKNLKAIGFGALLCGQVLIGTRTASAEIILSILPERSVGDVSGPAFLLLQADVTPDDAFFSFGLDVHYDPLMVAAVEARLHPAIFSGPQLDPDLSRPGVIGLTGFVPFPGPPVSGTVRLAILEFRLLQPGSSLVTVSFDGPTQGFGLPFPPGDVVLPDQINDATLVAIPEPGTFSLALMGVLGLLGMGWRSRREALADSTAAPESPGA